MRGLKRVGVVVLLALLTAIPVLADKASTFYEKARDAEARQDYEQAYDLYKQAHDLKPSDLRYRTAFERIKLYAAAAKVHRGQMLRDAGKLADALAEFEAARQIDPSNFVAQQEAQRTRKMLDDLKKGLPIQQNLNQPKLSERVQQAASPVELAPISQTPITLKLVEDAKAIYETIGKLAGINVLFDPDYTSRRIRIELNGVTLEQALHIVALESHTFWRPVTPNTIYVAQDSQAKRNELEQQVLRTFYLGNLSASTEIQDVTNTLRTILRLERVQQLPSQNAIVVRGTPDQVAMAEKLINDIDKARPEVIVDVAVMQVQKEKLRNLGITPPFSTTANPTITLQSNTGTTTSSSSSTTTSTTGTTTSAGSINLNDLANLDARNFVLTIPPVSVTALANDSNTKVLENPQVRALDGQKATLKIGQRVPIATGSFSGTTGVSGVGINPLVNTQFQYTDVGVNIEITPHIHMNRDVTLKISMEISSIVSYSNIGGVNQPVIGQRKIEHEIRLHEGEVNMLGGILEETETQSMTGIPWLSSIPILKYLFGQSSKDHVNNEIVFVLTPHVVRGVELSDLNTRTIDVGTQNVVQVRSIAAPQPTPVSAPVQPPVQQQPGPQQAVPPQQQAPAPAPQAQPQTTPQPPQSTAPAPTPNQSAPAPQAANPQPGTVQQASANPPAAPDLGRMGSGPLLSFDPPLINQPAGATFTVNVTLTGAKNVSSIPAQIVYDPAVLQLVRVDSGEMLSKDGQTAALVQREDPSGGSVQVSLTRPPNTMGINGDGVVFRLTFMAKAAGKGIIAINRSLVRDPSQQTTEVAGSQAVVTVR